MGSPAWVLDSVSYLSPGWGHLVYDAWRTQHKAYVQLVNGSPSHPAGTV